MRALLFLTGLLLTLNLAAQHSGTVRHTVPSTEQSDSRSKNDMFNRQNPSTALQAGGAFYVPNPSPVYRVDVEKAYLTKDFVPITAYLVDGQEHSTNGRLRLLDQKWEIVVEGGVFDLDNRVVQRVVTADGRTFVHALDLLGRIRGIQSYEEVGQGAGSKLFVHHRADWEEPKEQNMFDTADPERTLKRREIMVLVTESDGNHEVKKWRDVVAVIAPDRAAEAKKFAKQHKLRNDPAGVARVLEHLVPTGDKR